MSKRRLRAVPNVVVISDLHCGCQMGLCIDRPVRLDGSGHYTPSRLQRIVWQYWLTFWRKFVPWATHGEPFAVVVNGDAIEGVHHGAKTQISQNISDQTCLAMEILRPIAESAAAGLYVVRGTESHVGKSAEHEETLARELGAVPDEDGHHTRYELWLRVGRGLVHCMHHIGSTGVSHYESTAVMRELAEAYQEAGRWEDEPPDIVVRSHRHRHIQVTVPTRLGYGIAMCTAGWQLHTPYARRIAGARQAPAQFGGSVIRQGDHDLYALHWTRTVGRSREEVPTCRDE